VGEYVCAPAPFDQPSPVTSTTATSLIVLVLAICVGTIIGIVSSGPPGAPRPAPRFAKLPGGIDPLPEFDTTEQELAFRGAGCRSVSSGDETLHRECQATERQ
jgi:hypothetical protein